MLGIVYVIGRFGEFINSHKVTNDRSWFNPFKSIYTRTTDKSDHTVDALQSVLVKEGPIKIVDSRLLSEPNLFLPL